MKAIALSGVRSEVQEETSPGTDLPSKLICLSSKMGAFLGLNSEAAFLFSHKPEQFN